MNDLKENIRKTALEIGFSRCGFTRNESLEPLRANYEAWLDHNRDTGLDYLATHLEKRLHPEQVMPGARTVIALLMNYYTPEPATAGDHLIIARYARVADYHTVVKRKLEQLASYLTGTCGAREVRSFVDSGRVLEKAWAVRCGIGWQGKNSLIINPECGSYTFIGILLTDLETGSDEPAADGCHRCDRCVRACPTGALNTPYRLDVARCIAYHTIETKEEIPPEIREKLGRRIFGCDICQEICPYNRLAAPHRIPEFTMADNLAGMKTHNWNNLTEREFDALFADSPVKRTGFEKLLMNIRAASPSEKPADQSPPSAGCDR